eukprot:2749370-Rhodomonas_salina.1
MSYGGGLESTALTLAGVMRSLVCMPAVTTETQIQDGALEPQCQRESDGTSTGTVEESAAPVSGTVDLGPARAPALAGLMQGSRDQTSECAVWGLQISTCSGRAKSDSVMFKVGLGEARTCSGRASREATQTSDEITIQAGG